MVTLDKVIHGFFTIVDRSATKSLVYIVATLRH